MSKLRSSQKVKQMEISRLTMLEEAIPITNELGPALSLYTKDSLRSFIRVISDINGYSMDTFDLAKFTKREEIVKEIQLQLNLYVKSQK